MDGAADSETSAEGIGTSPGELGVDRDAPPDGLDVEGAIAWYEDASLYRGEQGEVHMRAVLAALGLSEADARRSSEGGYDVSGRFVIRAAWWQIDQGLGLKPDGLMGSNALVRLGVDPPSGDWAVWNADDLRSGEADPRLEELFELDTFMTRCLQVITLGGTDKRFGDITGDAGIAVGIQHLTDEYQVRDLFRLMYETHPDAFLQIFFGDDIEGRTVEDVISALGLDADGGRNETLARIAASVHDEAFLQLMSDPRFQDVQVEYFRRHSASDLARGREIGGSATSIGTAALCVCIGNSSTAALDDIGYSEDQHAEQLTIGEVYASERPGGNSPRNSEVGPEYWRRLHAARASGGAGVEWEATARDVIPDLPARTRDWRGVSSSPNHRNRRLRALVQYFGDVWDRPFQEVDATGGGSGEELQMPDLDASDVAEPEPPVEAGLEQVAPPSPEDDGGESDVVVEAEEPIRRDVSTVGRERGRPEENSTRRGTRGDETGASEAEEVTEVVAEGPIVDEQPTAEAAPEIAPVAQQRLVLSTPALTYSGETIVHLPDGFDPTAPLEVLVHLHGYHFEAGEDGEPTDTASYRVDTNLQGSGRNMIAILPVGSSESRYAPSGQSFDTDGLVAEILGQLADREPTWGWRREQLPPVEHLILSGSSGAGNSLHSGERAPITDGVDELVLFDTLNRDRNHPDEVISPQTLDAEEYVCGRIQGEIEFLVSERDTNEARLEYLDRDGFRLQVYYSTDRQYTERALHLRQRVQSEIEAGRGRFDDPDPVLAALRDNYDQFHEAGVSHRRLVGASLGDALAGEAAPEPVAEISPVTRQRRVPENAPGGEMSEQALEPSAELTPSDSSSGEAPSPGFAGPLSAGEEMDAILYNRGDTQIGSEARGALLHPAWVQRMQRFVGVSDANCRGHFERETVQCIARWQGDHGLTPTGRVDAESYAALVAAGCDDADIELEELELRGFSVRNMTNEQYRSGEMTDEAEDDSGARSDAEVRDGRLRDAGEGGWSDWAAEIQRCSFLGRGVRCHSMLRERLALAQAYIMQQPSFAGMTPEEVGRILIKEDIKDLRHDTKYHGYGLAIDIDYETNPWIGGQHTDNSKYEDNDRHALCAVWRAVWLTGRGSPISPEDSHTRAAEETTEELITHFGDANAALEQYFAARNDDAALADLVAGWDREAPPSLPEGLELDVEPSTLTGLDADGWRERIATDWELTHDTDESNWQKGSSFRTAAGFFDIAEVLVVALRDAAGMAWGASDFEGEASGDFMHFDCRTDAFARRCVEG